MRRTVFNTPVISHFFLALSWIALKITGWSVEGQPPKEDKYVLIGAPHTSNWDFPLALAIFFLLRFDVRFLGKDTLFKGPVGPLMHWLGGFPVDRSTNNNIVQDMIDIFKDREHLVLVIAPEGTRSRVKDWKQGFYHIAHGAGIPIGMALIDYKRKTVVIGPTFYPTGNVEKDIKEIRKFYSDSKH